MTLAYAPRLSKPTTININDHVRVKLNDFGRRIHRKAHEDAFRDSRPHVRNAHPYREPEVGDDGCVAFQLWELMETFGPHMHHGGEMPFETSFGIIPWT